MNKLLLMIFFFCEAIIFVSPSYGQDLTGLGAPNERIVLFRTDSSVIDPPNGDRLISHAKFLAENPTLKVRIEAHTDLRGSREYNLALGERRVQAVFKVLLTHGATPEQFDSVSFGEEIRIRKSGDAVAMAYNRRVELVYQ